MPIRKVISRSILDGTVAPIDTTGTVTNLSVTALSASIAATATDVFVYDTRKDSDGGAWRKRTSNTSWYNETLNTGTRGSRRDFPAVAVIVCTATTMTIYDGDSPDLPMWMVFSSGGINDWPTGTHTRMAVTALNGGIVVGTEDGGQWFRFIDDTTHIIYSNLTYNVTSNRSISNRNGVSSFTTNGGAINTYAIAHWIMNDVAMTVLPNAPIDAGTGLPTPTIAIATPVGVSVINNNGTVANLSSGENNDAVFKVTFTDDNRLAFSYSDTSSNLYGFVWVGEIPASSYAAGAMHGYSNPTSTIMSEHYNYAGNSGAGSGTGISTPYPTKPKNEITSGIYGLVTTKNRTMSIGSGSGLMNIIRPTPHVLMGMDGAANAITKSYNSGWMPGDIRGAWLSDSTAESITGGNKLSSTTFYNTGWSTSGGNLFTINVNGTVSVGTIGGDSYLQSPSFTCVVGRTYSINYVSSSQSGTGLGIYLNSAGGPNNYLWDRNFVFVATQTSNSFFLYRFGGHAGTATLTSISVKECDTDRSIKFQDEAGNKTGSSLAFNGTIVKSAVATGNDLVAYSGFSASNYLQAPYSSEFDFGTGDFSAMIWFKSNTATAANQPLFWRGQTTTNGYAMIEVYVGSTYNNIEFITRNAAETTQYQASGANVSTVMTQTWRHVCCVRRNGILYIYIDGVLVASGTQSTNNLTAPTVAKGTLNVGTDALYTKAIPGSVALFKISATAPSPALIARIYNDEKLLFDDGAKACLYGSSDQVNDIAYDDSTDLLHAGTSSGRSVFDGLRRVDNTTTGVSAAISVSNGLVAEQ
jgi:trimeric autotransporter adhesin